MTSFHELSENIRRFWYPRLHDILKTFGLGSTGYVYNNQYSYTFRCGEKAVEARLKDNGFQANPIAYYKSTQDGRQSLGSWVLTYEKANPNPWEQEPWKSRDMNNKWRQLHITLFESRYSPNWIDMYAHEEYDWRDKWYWHLKEKNFYPETGPDMIEWFLNEIGVHDDLYFYKPFPEGEEND